MASIRLNKPCQYLLLILLFCVIIMLLSSLRIYSDNLLQQEQKFPSIFNRIEDDFEENPETESINKDVFKFDNITQNPKSISNQEEKIKKSNCDTIIQLAIVCAGHQSNRGLYVLLKSILFYRKDPIHLHLMVDEESHYILGNLFKTSQISGLNVTFYNATPHESDVSWIPNRHYSCQYGLLKLVFLSV